MAEPPTILFLGGWSPGPWVYLEPFLRDYQKCSRRPEIIELNNIPMPPFMGNWLCNKDVMGIKTMIPLGLILFTIFYILPTFIAPVQSVILNIFVYSFLILYMIAWCRWFVAVVVRTSIKMGVDICLKEIYHIQQTKRNNSLIIVIGFSWGGAVVAEMIAQSMIQPNDPRLSALLIAPTTALVAKFAKERDAALRVQQQQLDAAQQQDTLLATTPCNNIHVVHGAYDDAFCPHQNRWEETFVALETVHDNHVFLTRSSSEILMKLLDQIITQQQQPQSPPQQHSPLQQQKPRQKQQPQQQCDLLEQPQNEGYMHRN